MILLVVPIFLLAAYWFVFHRFKLSLTGSPKTSFFGNVFDLKSCGYNIHILLDRYVKKYGNIFQFNYQGEKPIVIADGEIVKEILQKQASHFRNRKFFIELPWPCPDMITMLKDDKWKYIRSLLSPAFTPHGLKKLNPLLVRSSNTYMKKLEEARNNDQMIDVVSHSQGFVLEALLSILFSLDVPNQSDFNKALLKLVYDFIQPPSWINWFCLLPFGNRFVKYIPSVYKDKLQPFIDTATGIVATRKNDETGQHSDLLDALLNVQKAGIDKNGNSLSDGDILAQGIVVLTAVQVQTSTTLALAIYHIAKDKEIQRKIKEELDSLDADEDFPTWNHLVGHLTYLEQVIKETMRLYPSAYMLMRECNKSCTIKNVYFEEGASVLIPLYSMHRDEKVWNQPEVFNPDRFSNETQEPNYLPFGEGPHMCIGNRMAIIELKLVLAKMLHQFEIQLDNPSDVFKIQSHISVQAMITITKPINIRIKERV